MFFAHLRREIGVEQLTVEAPQGADVRTVASLIETQHGLSLKGCMVAVNENYATPDHALQDGDEVAFLPPVAGGSDNGDTYCEMTDQPLLLQAADAFLIRPECGAQAYFVGTVRSPNRGKNVEHIDYEGYVPMAHKIMQDAADAVRQKHGELRIWIQHRTGRLRPGEASILIGVASPHRRAALEACDFLIEYLKVQIPVWKHEADDDGQHWVEGHSEHTAL